MKTAKRMTDFSDLREILPEALQEEIRKMEQQEKRKNHDGKGRQLRIMLDSKGRKGKIVTVISGFQHNPQTMEEIARMLKEFCGAGGTVKGMTIEVQGNQKDRIAAKLRQLNYSVK